MTDRTTISISAALTARMKRHDMNWSRIAGQAIEQAIDERETKQDAEVSWRSETCGSCEYMLDNWCYRYPKGSGVLDARNKGGFAQACSQWIRRI